MNSQQRRKAKRAYKILSDFVVIRLRFSGKVTDEEIQIFRDQDNFLLKRPPPGGSYWTCLSTAGLKLGLKSYANSLKYDKERNSSSYEQGE